MTINSILLLFCKSLPQMFASSPSHSSFFFFRHLRRVQCNDVCDQRFHRRWEENSLEILAVSQIHAADWVGIFLRNLRRLTDFYLLSPFLWRNIEISMPMMNDSQLWSFLLDCLLSLFIFISFLMAWMNKSWPLMWALGKYCLANVLAFGAMRIFQHLLNILLWWK